MVAIGLIIGGLVLAAPALLALFNTMIALIGAGITMVVLGTILFGLVMIVTNKKFQTLMSYMFKSSMRKVTGAFVEIDPIGIMKSYIEDLDRKRVVMESSISKIKGQIKVAETQIDSNTAEYDRAMATMQVAKQKNITSIATVAGRQAIRIDKLNKTTLGPLLTQMRIHHKALLKYHEVTGTVIDDLKNEVRAQEMQRKMISESYSAMMTAKKILRGGTDQKELFDKAMEYVVNDYGMKMGEIEDFIDSSRGFVEGLDIQNGVADEEALKRLQEWEQKADSILLGSSKQQLLEQQYSATSVNVGIGAPAASQVDYSNLIGRRPE